MKNTSITLLTIAILMLPAFLFANHQNPKNVASRAAPVGKVYRTGDSIEKAAPAAVAEVSVGPRSAETVYKKCAMCHDSGLANAPIVGNKDQWAPRISKGLKVLVANAMNGTDGGMPAKGTCMDCTEEEINATVEFMLEKSQ